MIRGQFRNGFALGLISGIILTIILDLAIGPPQFDGNFSRISGSDPVDSGNESTTLSHWVRRFVSLEDTSAQWIMTVFSIVAAALLWRTLYVTQQMAKDTREIGVRQLRPYVGLSFARFTPEKNSAIVYLGLKNFGQTPARNVISWTHSWIEELPLTKTLPKPDSNERSSFSRASLPPQVETVHLQRHGVDINDYSREEIANGRAALYVYGEIQYEDATGEQRKTNYLLFCTDISGGEESRFKPYPTGNSET